jgi:hypothetical protein
VSDVIKVFVGMIAVMIPVAIGGALFFRLTFGRRGPRRRSAQSAAEIEQLNARIAELEMREDRTHELEERVDFVERMLIGLREGKTPEGLPPRRKETTPV